MNAQTIKEIASALGIGKRRAQYRAQGEAWPFAVKRERGGNMRTYPVATLPEDVQAALTTLRERHEGRRAQAADVHRVKRLREAQTSFDKANGRQREAAGRRVAALLRVAELHEATSLESARNRVAMETGYGISSLKRWGRTVRGFEAAQWPCLLLPGHDGGAPRKEIHPGAWAAFKQDFLRLEQPGLKSCYRRLKRQAATHRDWLPLPSISTFERRIRELPLPMRALLRQGEDDMMRMGPKIERDRTGLAALECVNADGHTFDVAVRFPDGSIGRAVVVGWQDVASGKLLSYRVGRSETAELVRLSFADMVRRYGIPQHAFLDNGRAFASKQNTGGIASRYRFKVRAEDPEGVFVRAGVRVHWVTPYNGKAKPIERAWRDFASDIAKRPEFSGAYLGNSPDNKPENYGSRAIDYTEFLAVLEDGVREHNARDGRRSTLCAGRSFDDTFGQLYAAATITKATESQLAMLLLTAELATVRKGTGEIRLAENSYWSEALAEYQGTKVEVRFDPDNLHAGVHVFLSGGAYLGFTPCTYKTGFQDTEAARGAIQAKRMWRKKQKEFAAAELAYHAAQPGVLRPIPDPEAPQAKVIKLHRPKRKANASTLVHSPVVTPASLNEGPRAYWTSTIPLVGTKRT